MKEHEILRMLMQNKLICPVSEPEAHKWLKDSKETLSVRCSQPNKVFWI